MSETIIQSLFVAGKLLVLFLLGIYLFFSFIIVRQERLMASVYEDDAEGFLRTLTVVHLGAALLLFAFAFLILP